MNSTTFLAIKREILSKFADEDVIPVPKDVLLDMIDALEEMEKALLLYNDKEENNEEEQEDDG